MAGAAPAGQHEAQFPVKPPVGAREAEYGTQRFQIERLAWVALDVLLIHALDLRRGEAVIGLAVVKRRPQILDIAHDGLAGHAFGLVAEHLAACPLNLPSVLAHAPAPEAIDEVLVYVGNGRACAYLVLHEVANPRAEAASDRVGALYIRPLFPQVVEQVRQDFGLRRFLVALL